MTYSQTALLQKYGIQVKGDLGQHLLLDLNVVRKIVDALDISENKIVLEIGPGLGALTHEMLRRGAQVIAIEKDPHFVNILEQELLRAFPKTLQVIHADVLDCDFNAICEGKGKIRMVSNLPYYITTPILFKLIEGSKNFSSAVLMMQKEVAEKLGAQAGSRSYGRLSAAAIVGEVQRLFSVAKGCFTPPPEVDSTVIRFQFKEQFELSEEKKKVFFEFLKMAFSARRKTLISLLLKQPGISMDRSQMGTVFSGGGLDLKARAEDLNAGQLIQIFLKIFPKRM